MKFWMMVSLGLVLSIGLAAQTADSVVNGKITKLSSDCKNMIVTTSDTPPKEVSITNSKGTKIDNDGRQGDILVLKLNMNVQVRIHDGTSTSITVTK